MEKEFKQDEFIRKMVRHQAPDKAPEGFTVRVMEKLVSAPEAKHEPVLSTGTWIAIFLGAAALVVSMIVIDMPFINRIFSSSGIQRFSLDLFTNRVFDSFILFFKELNINAISIAILIGFVSLVVVERIITRKRSAQRLLIL